jgi:phosphate transport system permease protein
MTDGSHQVPLGQSRIGLAFSALHPRAAFSLFCSAVAVGLSVLAMAPLFSVLYLLLREGAARLDLQVLTALTTGPGIAGGGIGNAIVGTTVVVGIAAALSVPVGFLGAVYLAEFASRSKVSVIVRFDGKVLTGLPSVLAGVCAYALVVTALGSFNALAGGVALAILMVPTVLLTVEEALRMVPDNMRQAARGMGCNQSQVVFKVVVPRAMPSILTGVMLALSRAMGETAPLLLTALFSDYWFEGKLDEPIASLAVLIYNYSGSPFEDQVRLAWAASTVLVALVLVLNLGAQWLTRRWRAN